MGKKTQKNLNGRSRRQENAAQVRNAILGRSENAERDYGLQIGIEPARPSRQILNPKQAGWFLGVTPKTLANWRCSGDGPVFQKIGSRCLYRRSDLVTFQRKRRFRSTSSYPAVDRSGEA